MSPVARRTGRGHTGRAVGVAVAVVGLALAVAFGVAALASRGEVEVRLGDDLFEAGKVQPLARDIRERGAPLAFGDPATGRRPIWIDHRSAVDAEGWVAFGAFLPEDPSCTVNWRDERDRYVADCDESITFPRSGEGLRAYPVRVEGEELLVDLRDPE